MVACRRQKYDETCLSCFWEVIVDLVARGVDSHHVSVTSRLVAILIEFEGRPTLPSSLSLKLLLRDKSERIVTNLCRSRKEGDEIFAKEGTNSYLPTVIIILVKLETTRHRQLQSAPRFQRRKEIKSHSCLILDIKIHSMGLFATVPQM